MARRLRTGDVLELKFPNVPSPSVSFPAAEYGYLTYVGKHPRNGDAVRVRPGVLSERPPITEELFADSYVTFYAANLALRHNLVSIVGKLAPVQMPTVFRRGALRINDHITPHLIDTYEGENRTTFLKYKLSEEEKKIPIAESLNHEALLIHIARGWKPEWESEDASPPDQDSLLEGPLNDPPLRPIAAETSPQALGNSEPAVKDAATLHELAQASDMTQPRNVRHYLYLQTKRDAQQVATGLRKHGFDIEVKRAAIGRDWLVLASHCIVITGEYIAATRQALEQMVQPLGGQYDGWEAAVS